MPKDSVKIGSVSIPINQLINFGLKGIFGSIPRVFNIFLPKWKRNKIINKLKGVRNPEAPSVEDILK